MENYAKKMILCSMLVNGSTMTTISEVFQCHNEYVKNLIKKGYKDAAKKLQLGNNAIKRAIAQNYENYNNYILCIFDETICCNNLVDPNVFLEEALGLDQKAKLKILFNTLDEIKTIRSSSKKVQMNYIADIESVICKKHIKHKNR